MNMTEGQCTGSRAIIQAAVKEQEEIGWKHFFSGRLSKKWQEALELDHKAREAQNPTAKITPISSFIRIIWEARLSLWKRRNEMKHGKTPQEREENQRKILEPRIREAYRNKYKKMTPTSRRQLFKVDVIKRLKFRSKTNHRWLEIVETAEKAHSRRTAYLLSRMPRLQTYYRVTKKRTRITLRSERRLIRHCITSSKQSDISEYVLRWDPPPVSEHEEYYRIMGTINENHVVDEESLEEGQDRSIKTRSQQKVTDFYNQKFVEENDKEIEKSQEKEDQRPSTEDDRTKQ